MASDDVSWVSVEGLYRAAEGIDAQGRRQFEILSRLYGRVNMVDPEVFGDDKNGREFYAKWSKDVGDWDDGVRTIVDSTIATGYGVTNMARAFKSADDDTTTQSDELGRFMSDGLPPLFGGGGGGGTVPPVGAPPVTGGDGGGGGGNGGGGNGRH